MSDDIIRWNPPGWAVGVGFDAAAFLGHWLETSAFKQYHLMFQLSPETQAAAKTGDQPRVRVNKTWEKKMRDKTNSRKFLNKSLLSSADCT